MLPLLFLLFILLPIAELWLIIEIGGAIGVVPTLALLIVDSLVGAAVARSQSRAAWERFNGALAAGRVPAKEVFDGAMIIIGGALLLTPGFITDVFGLALLLPPSRAVIRGFLKRLVGRRGAVAFRVAEFGYARRPGSRAGQTGPNRDYDYEGSASEVTDPPEEIDPGSPRGGHG
ncbi:MAG: FxsA family protein [Actinomycetota bacterium]|nr:FxsA family protein [Actinomycetota bacterium]